MKLGDFESITLIAQLVEYLSFVLEDLGSNPAGGRFFFSCSFYIFEKIRVSRSFFGASKPIESNKLFVDQIGTILEGH